jgi:hypothetical protein
VGEVWALELQKWEADARFHVVRMASVHSMAHDTQGKQQLLVPCDIQEAHVARHMW